MLLRVKIDPVDCPHFDAGICQVASAIAGVPGARVPILCNRACPTCLTDGLPQQRNQVTASLAIAWAHHENRTTLVARLINQNLDVLPRIEVNKEKILQAAGCGTLLHDSLKRKGFEIEPGCSCLRWIDQMNKNGPAWARDHLPDISAAMVEEFKRRRDIGKLPPTWTTFALKAAGDRALTLLADREILKACRQSEQQHAIHNS